MFDQLYRKKYQHSQCEIDIIRCVMTLVSYCISLTLDSGIDVNIFSYKYGYEVWLQTILICRVKRTEGSIKHAFPYDLTMALFGYSNLARG